MSSRPRGCECLSLLPAVPGQMRNTAARFSSVAAGPPSLCAQADATPQYLIDAHKKHCVACSKGHKSIDSSKSTQHPSSFIPSASTSHFRGPIRLHTSLPPSKSASRAAKELIRPEPSHRHGSVSRRLLSSTATHVIHPDSHSYQNQ